MKLTKKQAVELSTKKWEYIVNNDGKEDDLLDRYPELNDFLKNCGLCEKYWKGLKCGIKICTGCPLIIQPILNIYKPGCRQENHPFYIWDNKRTKKNAQAVLDLIKSIKV